MPISEITQGPEWRAAGRTIIPFTRALWLRLPGSTGGLVWSRPLKIAVDEAGRRRFVKVPDRTRQLQWILLGAGLIAGLWIRRSRRKFSRR